jgi:hypothetical protein
MSAINQINQNNILDTVENNKINDVQNLINQENNNPISPETKKLAEETRELLKDIYYNYKQIPNPSSEVQSRMDEIQTKLKNLNGELVTLTDKELDHLVNIKDNFADTTFKKMLNDMDECLDNESVDEHAQAINRELEQAYKGGKISTTELAQFVQTTIDQVTSTKSKIEMLDIKEQEGKLEKCEDQQDYANGLEDLRTSIVGAKFIDYHTKVDMLEHINQTLISVGKKTKPSPKTRKFLEELAKRKQEQQEKLNEQKIEINNNKKVENIKEEIVIDEKKKMEMNKQDPKMLEV